MDVKSFPYSAPMDFTDDQVLRYARHLVLPEVGEEGQAKLLQSRVLVIGAGGLGSPLLLYLAAAGVGHLGVIDDDTVDLANLQRQILHDTSHVGLAKVVSAKRRLAEINPEVELTTHEARLSPITWVIWSRTMTWSPTGRTTFQPAIC